MKPAVQADQMPAASKYNTRNPGRVERLLRERELRKFNRIFNLAEAGPANSKGNGDGGGGGGLEFELGLLEREMGVMGLGRDLPRDEAAAAVGSTSASAAAAGAGEGGEGRPQRQRLLVVANRLPVSAVRRGEDSWSLDISAGGLVSALLGEYEGQISLLLVIFCD